MVKGANLLIKFKKGDFLFGTDGLETIIKIKQIDTIGEDLPRSVLINSKYAYWESITGNKKKSFAVRTLNKGRKEIVVKLHEPVRNSQKFFLKIMKGRF